MPAAALLCLVTLYLLALFALARWGERRALRAPLSGARRAWVHGLALGVYCSTWTVFGAIGSAVREGYAYLPIYLGPLLMALLAPYLWERLVQLKQRHRLASVADLLGARYGRGGALPALVALLALVAVVPYVALQFTAIGGALQVLGVTAPGAWVAAFGLLMVLFTLRFGVRDARTLVERPGLILVLAIESAVKLLIVLGLALWAAGLAGGTPLDWHRLLLQRATPDAWVLAGQTLLAAAASLLLPRMFQVGVVECAEPRELPLARRVFAGYLLLVSVAVLPIAALAGAAALPAAGSDHLLVGLPLARGQDALALLALLAGLSAASAMMIAAWLALSTMVSNDLLVPLLLRARVAVSADRVLALRRGAVLVTALASLAWYAGTAAGTLVQMGLLAFAGVAQFAPAVLAAVHARRSSAAAALAGLLVGAAGWLFLLVLPYLGGTVPGSAELTLRALLALGLNALALLLWLRLWPASLRQRLAAADFLETAPVSQGLAARALGTVRADDLYLLLERLLGARRYRHLLQLQWSGALPDPAAQVQPALLQAAERAVAEVFGSASARELLARGLSGQALSVDAVLGALDQSSARYRTSRELLAATFEHMHQAVSVVDTELRLAAWNRRYESLYEWSPGLLEPGRPIADLIADAARARGLDPAAVQERVQRRLAQLRAATSYRSVRSQPDGRVLDVRGEPLPEGGFVTTFFDITESVRAARALEEANLRLEERVAARTRELQRLGELKNQFLAAASHDLLQPLSAARLYLSAAQGAAGAAEQPLLARADAALAASEELLSGLTDLARLDTGQLRPEPEALELRVLFASLEAQAQALAAQRGLRLRVRPSAAWVRSDPRLLRRIVQNYLANALRYTARGGVLVGVRRRAGGRLEIMVCDSGPGIDPQLQPRLFGELGGSGGESPWGERGLGLGLAGCRRLADALGHQLTLRSEPGRGSCFGVLVERSAAPAPAAPAALATRARLEHLRVLCVDDHAEVRTALATLLGRWGMAVAAVDGATGAHAALASQDFDVAIVDQHLGRDQPAGLQLLAGLRARQPGLRAILLTAETDTALPALCAAAGVALLRKPARPAALRALLESLRPS